MVWSIFRDASEGADETETQAGTEEGGIPGWWPTEIDVKLAFETEFEEFETGWWPTTGNVREPVSPQRLVELYWYEDLYLTEIAHRLEEDIEGANLSESTISLLMESYSIPRKPRSEYNSDRGGLRWDAKRLKYHDWLTPRRKEFIERYVVGDERLKDIAKDLGVSEESASATVCSAIDRLNEIAAERGDYHGY